MLWPSLEVGGLLPVAEWGRACYSHNLECFYTGRYPMPTMRVVTYNIEFGVPERLAALTTALEALPGDIITLNEADHPAVVAELAARLGLFYVWERGSGDRHIATLSRFPIRTHRIENRPPLTQAVLQTWHETPWGMVAVYNCHFLPYLLLPYELQRWRAAGALLRLIRAATPGPHLIVGDLNAIGPGDRVLQRRNPPRMRRVMWLQLGLIFRLALPRLLRAGYTDCFRALNPTADGFTWRPGNLTTRYDYILADPVMTARLRACHVVEDAPCLAEASDHLPLLAEFGWDSAESLLPPPHNAQGVPS